MFVPSQHKKDLNFELNLLPVFDVLSVCICFLLMTVVWVQTGSFNVSQAVGGQAKEGKNPPSMWVSLNGDGKVTFTVKDAPQKIKDVAVTPVGGRVNWNQVGFVIQNLHNQVPDLKTGLVLPTKTTAYEDIIKMMDQFRKYQLTDVGISPL